MMETIEDELMNLSVEPLISNTGSIENTRNTDDMKNKNTPTRRRKEKNTM